MVSYAIFYQQVGCHDQSFFLSVRFQRFLLVFFRLYRHETSKSRPVDHRYRRNRRYVGSSFLTLNGAAGSDIRRAHDERASEFRGKSRDTRVLQCSETPLSGNGWHKCIVEDAIN